MFHRKQTTFSWNIVFLNKIPGALSVHLPFQTVAVEINDESFPVSFYEKQQLLLPKSHKLYASLCCFRGHERTADDLEIIYEELLHIRALSHLSNSVKREIASVIVFEAHPKAGTVCKLLVIVLAYFSTLCDQDCSNC